MNRRQMLKRGGLMIAGAAGGGFSPNSLAAAEEVRARVNTNSEPSQLKITDMRVVPILGSMRSHVIRLDTNQGISGYGEVRDGASPTYALMLKSRILGENPCHVDKIFRKLKQFGGHARQAGGVVAVEMACWDLAGKAWGVPCWQMLGGKFRDAIRLYADTTTRAPTARRWAEDSRRGANVATPSSRWTWESSCSVAWRTESRPPGMRQAREARAGTRAQPGFGASLHRGPTDGSWD